jgi:hypothetical protein
MKKLFFVLALSVSSLALAAKPYGMGGCGLGSQLMGKDGNQVLAITSNGTSGNQTFGISSGTSNCVTASEQTAQIKTFIDNNYDAIITDMAKGQGETIRTLSGFYGCNTEALGTELQAQYAKVAPAQADSGKMMVNINNLIDQSQTLSASCTDAI